MDLCDGLARRATRVNGQASSLPPAASVKPLPMSDGKGVHAAGVSALARMFGA